MLLKLPPIENDYLKTNQHSRSRKLKTPGKPSRCGQDNAQSLFDLTQIPTKRIISGIYLGLPDIATGWIRECDHIWYPLMGISFYYYG